MNRNLFISTLLLFSGYTLFGKEYNVHDQMKRLNAAVTNELTALLQQKLRVPVGEKKYLQQGKFKHNQLN